MNEKKIDITGDFYAFGPKGDDMLRISIKIEQDEALYHRLYEYLKSDVALRIDYGERMEGAIDYLVIFQRSIILHVLVSLTADVLKYYNKSIYLEMYSISGERSRRYATSNLVSVIRKNINLIANSSEYDKSESAEKALIESYKKETGDFSIVSAESANYEQAVSFSKYISEHMAMNGIGGAKYAPEKKYLAECRSKKVCAICGHMIVGDVGIIPVCSIHLDEYKKMKGKDKYEQFKKKHKLDL